MLVTALFDAFFFATVGTKKKALQKKKCRFRGPPRPTPAPPFEKGGRKLKMRSAPSVKRNKLRIAKQ